MTVRVQGETDVTELPREELWVDGRLVTYYRTWQGSADAMAAFIGEQPALFANSYRRRQSGSVITISAEYDPSLVEGSGGEGIEKITWELDRPLIEKDIKTSPYWATQESDRAKRCKWFAIADRYLETLDFDEAIRLSDKMGVFYSAGQFPDWVNAYIQDRQEGVETYQRNYWVVRKTVLVTSRSKYLQQDQNNWTSSSTSPLDGAAFSDKSPGERPKFVPPSGLKWLKVPGQCREVSRRRYQLVVEYWGADDWNTRYYPEAGS